MIARRVRLAAVLGVCLSGAAAQAQPLPLVTMLAGRRASPRLNLVEQQLVQGLARSSGQDVVPPTQTFGILARDAALRALRERAAAHLEEATSLVLQVRYDEALRKIESAELAALEGLARFIDAKLLADIYLQRGIALFPSDSLACQRYLVWSFQHGPERSIDEANNPPKIVRALIDARDRARAAPLPAISPDEAAAVARALGGRALIAVFRPRAETEELHLVLHDAVHAGASRSTAVQWPAGATAATVAARLDAALQELVAGEQRQRPTRRGNARRVGAWSLLGASAAALIVGSALYATANTRISDAEALAGETPLVPYSPRVADLEDQAQRFETGAAVGFALAGGAAAAAALLFLWPTAEHTPASGRLTFGAGSVGWSLGFP